MEASDAPLKPISQTITCHMCTLKIPNFFTSSVYRENNFDIISQSFEFDNATWSFRCYSKQQSRNEFKISIFRMKTAFSDHVVYYKIALLDASGRRFDQYSSVFEIDDDCNECRLWNVKTTGVSSDKSDTLTLIIQLFQFESTQEVNVSPRKKHSLQNLVADTNDIRIHLTSTNKSVTSYFYKLKLLNFFTSVKKQKTFSMFSPNLQSISLTCCLQFCSDNLTVSFEPSNAERQHQKAFVKCLLFNYKGEKIGKDCKVLMFSGCRQNAEIGCRSKFKSPFCTLLIHFLWEEDLGPILMGRDLTMLSRDFRQLFLNGTDSDLTLRVAGTEFRVHRLILKARSEVFEAMLSHDMAEKNKGIIDITDVDAQAMELLLVFVYTGEVGSLNQDNVFGVYYAADKYNLMFLKDRCCEFMKISLSRSTFCDIIQLAINHIDTNLLECCTRYFVNYHSDIVSTAEWKSFKESNPIAANALDNKISEKCAKSQIDK